MTALSDDAPHFEQQAWDLACTVHAGQVDSRTGKPRLERLGQVVAALATPPARAAAWLSNALEYGGVNLDQIREMVPAAVAEAVELLDRPYERMRTVAVHPLARLVLLEDLVLQTGEVPDLPDDVQADVEPAVRRAWKELHHWAPGDPYTAVFTSQQTLSPQVLDDAPALASYAASMARHVAALYGYELTEEPRHVATWDLRRWTDPETGQSTVLPADDFRLNRDAPVVAHVCTWHTAGAAVLTRARARVG